MEEEKKKEKKRKNITDFKQPTREHDENVCKLITFLENVVGNASAVTILAISVERHRVAYRANHNTAANVWGTVCKTFLLIWLFSVLGALPILFIAQYEQDTYVDGTPVGRCMTPIDHTWQKIYLVLSALLFFILPLLVILFLYSKVNLVLKCGSIMRLEVNKSNVPFPEDNTPKYYSGYCNIDLDCRVYMKLMTLFRREQERCLTYPREILRLRRQMTQIIITVVLVFFICHTPYRTIGLWSVFSPRGYPEGMDNESYFAMFYMFRFLLYSNHAINPFVYNFVSR
ncbi:thyrotropin-releasing hormone receptor [Elysia marginata]|uniref:Thyrotropin-releasing hormone receptor n=1 Tax=Elysia marginata TaxID=1093978 RepID=A0AAV4JLR7_9GAST|nr:thyrotropin-releasing hormone receptor [Elysia marginata]